MDKKNGGAFNIFDFLRNVLSIICLIFFIIFIGDVCFNIKMLEDKEYNGSLSVTIILLLLSNLGNSIFYNKIWGRSHPIYLSDNPLYFRICQSILIIAALALFIFSFF